MELAGLACAMTVQRCFPPATHPRVLIAAGPGNQGGDGLVAARHLRLFGYAPTLYYPKGEDKTPHYGKLWRQASHAGVERIDTFDESALADADVCLDAIFGFSFKGAPRPPFDDVLAAFKRTKTPIVSVDIPSGARLSWGGADRAGWHVDDGNSGDFFTPGPRCARSPTDRTDVLISLTAPKRGVATFKGALR